MTTLPQTTIRVPRPAAPNQLILPSTPGSVAVASPTAGMTGADAWRVIRSNLWLITLAFVVSIIVGAVLNYYLRQNYARFTAAGLIQVKPPANPNALLNNNQNEFAGSQALSVLQKTQVPLLKHPALLDNILKNDNSDIRKTSWYELFKRNPDDAKKDLLTNLRVSPIPDTSLIEVAMTWSNAAEAKTILEVIVNQHLQEQELSSRQKQTDQTAFLNNVKRQYEFKLRDSQEKVHQKAIELSVDGMGTAGRISGTEIQLSNLLNQQMGLQAVAQSAQSSRDALTAQLQQGNDPQKIDDLISRDAGIQQTKAALFQAEANLAGFTRMGTGHPTYVAAIQRRDALQKQYEDMVTDRKLKLRQSLLDEMKYQVNETTSNLEAVAKRVVETKNKLGELNNKMSEYLTEKDKEVAYKEMVKRVQNQIDAINQLIGNQNLSSVSWSQRPIAPESPSFPQLPVTITMSIFVGLALSVGVAFLRELMDTTIRSPRDITRVGQMNLLGMVPHEDDDPQATGARLPLVIFEAPHSVMAEQLRQVRTRLQHTTSLDTTRSILVTGPSPGDGRTTIATNLAAGLALNGRRILLVDANFRRPELHRVFDVPNEKGFSDVLNNVELFDQAKHETQVPNLAVLPCGPKPTNATELLESQLLIDFIEKALEEFDHVIFDSGPLLFVSESVALAPRVDGVITIVRARSSSRGLLQRMRDSLRQLKAEHVGVVLNGVRSQGGGYYGKNIKAYYAYQQAELEVKN